MYRTLPTYADDYVAESWPPNSEVPPKKTLTAEVITPPPPPVYTRPADLDIFPEDKLIDKQMFAATTFPTLTPQKMPGPALLPALLPLVGNLASKIFPKKKKAAAVVESIPNIARAIIEQPGVVNRGASSPAGPPVVPIVPPQPATNQRGRNVWAWVAGGGAVALVLLLLLKRRR